MSVYFGIDNAKEILKMTEKYYSIIYPCREYIIEEETKYIFKIVKGTLYIYTTFDNEMYPIIKKCCVRYEPQEFFFILGWLRKLFYSIYYIIYFKKEGKKATGN